eukprot:4139696-Amphidinium_carterae.1
MARRLASDEVTFGHCPMPLGSADWPQTEVTSGHQPKQDAQPSPHPGEEMALQLIAGNPEGFKGFDEMRVREGSTNSKVVQKTVSHPAIYVDDAKRCLAPSRRKKCRETKLSVCGMFGDKTSTIPG